MPETVSEWWFVGRRADRTEVSRLIPIDTSTPRKRHLDAFEKEHKCKVVRTSARGARSRWGFMPH